jgi:Resolvase, N terminal domain
MGLGREPRAKLVGTHYDERRWAGPPPLCDPWVPPHLSE